MSDDSDTNIARGSRKRKVILTDDSSDSDDSFPVTAPKKRRKRRIVESESESDSSIEIIKRQRVGRILSDEEEVSSGSEIITRRRRNVTSLESDSESEFESDWISEVEEDNPPKPKSPAKTNNLSSSDDENAEKCPICLLTFKSQEVASPESCDHSFCVDCLLEWSKNVNTCPVDRQPYSLVLVRKHYNGKVIKQIPIQLPQPQQNVEVVEEDPTFCEVCGRSDREDRMLLCDTCDQGYHLECLSPPLDEVPMGLWFCEECESRFGHRRTLDFSDLLEEALMQALTSRSQTRRNHTR